MKRKLIAIDLDGTLLQSDYSLSPLTIDVLIALKEQGHLIVLNSGRQPKTILKSYDAIKGNGPIIAYNGNLIYNPSDTSFPRIEAMFSLASVKEALHRVGSKFGTILVEGKKGLVMNRPDAFLEKYFPYEEDEIRFGDPLELLDEDAYAFVWSANPNDDMRIQTAIETIDEKMRYRHWHSVDVAEAYLLGVHKGSAMEAIIRYYNIDKEDIISFGDSDNDAEMMALSGTAYAMKNVKSETLKKHYPLTKEDNDHDGVALTLKEIFSL